MKDSKSLTLVDDEEPTQTTDSLATIITKTEPASVGDQGTRLRTLKPTPATKKKTSSKFTKANSKKKPIRVIQEFDVPESHVASPIPQRQLTDVTSLQHVSPPPNQTPQSSL